MDAVAAGSGNTAIDISQYRHLTLQVSTASNANLTLKFQGSISNIAPDFDSAKAVDNMWDYIQVVDLEDGSKVDGDTGFAPAGTNDFRIFEINTNAIKWLRLVVTARSAGSVTVEGIAINDN